MTQFYFMLVDGRVFSANDASKQTALSKAFENFKFEYENFDDFFDDLNFAEWAEDGQYFLQNFVTNTLELLKVPKFTLPNFINVTSPTETELDLENHYE